jgi:copper homeostasis protein
MKPFNLEVCSNGLESSINAAKGGANRIELCSNLFEGGTTPSFATIQFANEIPNLVTRVMIRPRGGDFLYSDLEFELMKREIECCKNLNIEGVVFGLLLANGKIDIVRTKILINIARPMKVTFHRAFDMCENQFTALESLIDLGVNTVLTSGGKNKAIDGLDNLEQFVKIATDKIEIMVGSGVRPNNVKSFFEIGIRSFHLSGLMTIPSKMQYQNPNISMGSIPQIPEYDTLTTDIDIIKQMRLELEHLSQFGDF